MPQAPATLESRCCGPYAGIHIRVPPRLRQSWRLEWRRGEMAELSVPRRLLAAPAEIHTALLEWARLTLRGRRLSEDLRHVRRDLEHRVHAWLETDRTADAGTQRRLAAAAARRLQRLHSQGTHHDLAAVLAAVNAEYFAGTLRARITWSRRWGGLSTQSTQRDAAGNPYDLITVSRGYDHPSATADIVAGLVYHECLHIAVPPEIRHGKRVVHGREFRRREKLYRHYEKWREWHRRTLPHILRQGQPRTRKAQR